MIEQKFTNNEAVFLGDEDGLSSLTFPGWEFIGIDWETFTGTIDCDLGI